MLDVTAIKLVSPQDLLFCCYQLTVYTTQCYKLSLGDGRTKSHVRIFKNKPFARFAQKGALSDNSPCQALHDAERGLVAADLGGGVIKQRVARSGGGKSGGFRTLILFRAGSRAFFVHGFAKMKGTISTMTNWRLCADWRRSC